MQIVRIERASSNYKLRADPTARLHAGGLNESGRAAAENS